MRAYLNSKYLKTLLVFGLSIMVTIMIAPNLSLVPARYQEGDIITETIVVPDNIALVDQKSTEARRHQAVADFPPIYDYDARMRQKIFEAVAAAFQKSRDAQTGLSQARAESLRRIRQISLERIAVLSSLNEATADHTKLLREKNNLLHEMGQLTDLAHPTPEQAEQLEKVRFDLRAIEARRANLEATLAHLKARFAQLGEDSRRLAESTQPPGAEEALNFGKLKADFEAALGIQLEEKTFRALVDTRFSPEAETVIRTLLAPVLDLKIIASRESLLAQKQAIQIRTLDSTQLERFEALETIVDVAEVRREVAKSATEIKLPAGWGPTAREGLMTLAQRLVRPNLTENKGETERQRQELYRNTSPVYFNLKKGDVVARAGDSATAQQVEIIRALSNYNLENPKYPQIIGTFLIVLMTLSLMYRLIRQRAGATETRLPRLLLMSILLLVPLVLAQAILLIVPALTTVYDFIRPATYNFLIPVALSSMLAGILLRFEIAVYLGFAVSLSLAILLGNGLPFFLYGLMGSFVASIPMRRLDTRYALWQQGLRISAVNVAVLGVLSLLDQEPFTWAMLLDLAAGLANGFGCALLASTILPLLERAFDITTSLRLLELSNMNHPALKELAVRAPGTYHHSIVVGNLSESAAEGIRANPLLVRVASYYHDLGKMLCPLYFVENQHQKNYHDDLPAQTSARIIINHVRDGLEIARRYRLGKAITDIIAQHHGDSLVHFFYHKAQEEQGDLGGGIAEEEFRYPGPRPQTKEAGLVMCADVTEAAIRSLDDPSPEEIRQMVQKLTTRIYMEGQLDESGMTFNDLNFIEKTFTKMLLSIHHHRITYPDTQFTTKRKNRIEESGNPPDRTAVAGR
jgi:hypothetical protein